MTDAQTESRAVWRARCNAKDRELSAQATRIDALTTELQRAAEQRQADQAALAHAQERWRGATRRTRDLEAHLDAISTAHQVAVTTARNQLDVMNAQLEPRLTITLALAEPAAMIGVARALSPLEPILPQKRCESVSQGRQCVNAIALDKVGICRGPHDYSRPKLQVVGGDEHLQQGATK